MDRSGAVRWVVLVLALVAMGGWTAAGDAPKKGGDTPKAADEPKAKEKGKADAPENWVGQVDDVYITRDDLKVAQRQLAALNPKTAPPNYQQLLDQLVERVLWQRYLTSTTCGPPAPTCNARSSSSMRSCASAGRPTRAGSRPSG